MYVYVAYICSISLHLREPGSEHTFTHSAVPVPDSESIRYACTHNAYGWCLITGSDDLLDLPRQQHHDLLRQQYQSVLNRQHGSTSLVHDTNLVSSLSGTLSRPLRFARLLRT